MILVAYHFASREHCSSEMGGYIMCMLLTVLLWAEVGSAVHSQDKTFATEPGKMPDFPCPVQCTCNETILIVSCTKANLTTLPRGLSNRTRHLDLSENNFTHLSDGMFKGLTDLVSLRLTHNNISLIDDGVFQDVPNMTYLNIGQNPIGGSGALADLDSGLRRLHLKTLHLYDISMNRDDQNSLRNLTSLRRLDISYNPNIRYLQEDLFLYMENLISLRLASMKLFYLQPTIFKGLRSLVNLTLSNNTFSTFPFFFEGDQPLLPSLKCLDFSLNLLGSVKPNSLKFQNLEYLNFKYNVLTSLVENNFAYLPALKILNLEHNRIREIYISSFSSISLQSIILNDNKIVFGSGNLNVFRHLQGLQRLIVSRNAEMSPTFLKFGFRNLTNLQYLEITSIRGLINIPKGSFTGLRRLLTLVYSQTFLDNLDRDVFQDLVSLRFLDLRSNRITVINSTSLPSSLFQNLQKIDLSGNPFQCNCDLFWFTSWLNVTKVKIKNYRIATFYKCNSPRKHKGLALDQFHPEPNQCITVPMCMTMKISIGFSLLLVILTAMFSGFYRWKWKLRYMIFNLSSWWRASQTLYQNNRVKDDYKYDAFVGYNNEDAEWVNSVLLLELEERSDPPFRLCLYERDWLPGYGIINLIGESLENSRKTILIVTNSFAQSQWCQLELTMAQHKLFEEDQDNLILAIMEDIDPLNMTPRLALEMKRRTYLTWTEDAYGQQLFWEKLKKSLQKPLQVVSNTVPPIEEFGDPIN